MNDTAAAPPRLGARRPPDARLLQIAADARGRFLAALGTDAALIFGASKALRNGDAEHRFRQNSDVLYLSAWSDPDCAILLRPGSPAPFVMFVAPRDAATEVWEGRRYGVEGAKALFGADEAYAFDAISKHLPDLLQGYRTLHYRFAEDADRDRLLAGAIAKARKPARRAGLHLPDAFIDPARLLHELRLFKSPLELDVMRAAAAVTAEAHGLAMRATAPGGNECEIEAVIDGTFRRRGGSPGYTTIVGGGDNATILHYIANDCPLVDGDLLCVDAGCELQGYTADVTRTWPVNGRFTADQAALYQLVLDTEEAAIAQVRPGVTWKQVSDAAIRQLTEGLVRLGFFEGDPGDSALVDTLIQEEKYKRWYMHGLGHWLGLDVHDAGVYIQDGGARPFEPGMVTTIEPGLYVPLDDEQAPARFRGMGIRIEDDVLVTAGDPEVLTAAIPKSIEAVEAWMAGRS